MRITNQMTTNNTIRYIQESLERLNTLQEQSSTGKQFQLPSDDPINASQSLSLESALSVSAGYQKTANFAKEWMTATDTSLSELTDIANQATSVVMSGLNDTESADERASALVPQLTEMINAAVDLGNSTYQGSYLFSGVSVDSPAFQLSGTSTLSYTGTSKAMTRSIGQNSSVTLNINGDEAISPLIQAMIKARDDLTSNNTTDLATVLDDLKSALSTLTDAQSENGGRLQQVENTISDLESFDSNLKSILSDKEDTDTTEAAALLENQETTYQAVLEVATRTLSALNLFSYLQNS